MTTSSFSSPPESRTHAGTARTAMATGMMPAHGSARDPLHLDGAAICRRQTRRMFDDYSRDCCCYCVAATLYCHRCVSPATSCCYHVTVLSCYRVGACHIDVSLCVNTSLYVMWPCECPDVVMLLCGAVSPSVAIWLCHAASGCIQSIN